MSFHIGAVAFKSAAVVENFFALGMAVIIDEREIELVLQNRIAPEQHAPYIA